MGAQKFKGKVVISALGQGGGADLKYAGLLLSQPPGCFGVFTSFHT